MAKSPSDPPRFTIPLPRDRVARVPVEVLEKYADADARAAHAGGAPALAAGADAEPGATDRVVTINIYTSGDGVRVEQQHADTAAVVAHSMSVDPSTGASEWHTDWEYGECEYTDESGFPQRIQAWHRHPFGTEYTELYEG